MVKADKFGRTWKGRKIVWLRSSNSAREALYKWITVYEDGEKVNKLVYDKKSGMCDKRGYNVRKTIIEIIPALDGKTEGSWDLFPDTNDAYDFKKTLTYNGYDNTSSIVEELSEFDSYLNDEEIMVY
jgi:hypothetical protein